MKGKNPPKKQIAKIRTSVKTESGQENKKLSFIHKIKNKVIPKNSIVIDSHGKGDNWKNELDDKMDNNINNINIDNNAKKHIVINAGVTKSYYMNMNLNSNNKLKTYNEIKSEKTEIKTKKKQRKEKRRSKFIKEKPKKEILESSMSIIEDNEPKKKEIILDDYELNHLPYLEALELDKRDCCRTYCSILKRDHIILNTFCVYNDYNLWYVKLAKFMLILATLMAMNAFLFSDKAFHKLFLSGVHYYFNYHVLQIFLAVVITMFFEVFLCFLTLTDKYVYEIKSFPQEEKNGDKIFSILKCVRIKLFIFYIATFLILLFYWYFVSAFCAVYPNTQKLYLVYCLISFALYSIIPFIIYAVTTLFRVIAMKDNKRKKSNCIYLAGQSFPLL